MPRPYVTAVAAVFLAFLLCIPHRVLSTVAPASDNSAKVTPVAPVKVVTTLPILKEFAEQVGGQYVNVTTLITGFESEHSYSPKPGDLKAISQARLLVEIGLGLEIWVSGLVKNAGNAHLRVVTTSRGIDLIKEPAPEHGSQGNPHIWLDPENAKVMTTHIADGLMDADPSHKRDYQTNLDAYLKRIDDSQKALEQRAGMLKDRRIVTYHPAWPYFARRFGFRIEGTIIRQIGAEPAPAHLARLARQIKTEKIKVIVSEPQLNQKVAQALADETGARLVLLSPLPGAIRGTETYLAMLSYDIERLIAALQS
jgi:ABC-type Zn uptake system ZnuABC Zn-binding protein ZnuA